MRCDSISVLFVCAPVCVRAGPSALARRGAVGGWAERQLQAHPEPDTNRSQGDTQQAHTSSKTRTKGSSQVLIVSLRRGSETSSVHKLVIC